MFHGMWNLPGPGIDAVSPALAADSYPLYHQGSPPLQGTWIQSLVRELRSHMLQAMAKREKEKENPVHLILTLHDRDCPGFAQITRKVVIFG